MASSPSKQYLSYLPMIDAAARRYKLPRNIFRRLVLQESGGNPRATSPVGAKGLTQLMPGTASGLGVTDPFNPKQALDGGAKYLRQQLDRFGDIKLALAAYNAGPGNVEDYGGIPPFEETQNYVSIITSGLKEAGSWGGGSVRSEKKRSGPNTGLAGGIGELAGGEMVVQKGYSRRDALLDSARSNLEAVAGGRYQATKALENTVRNIQRVRPDVTVETGGVADMDSDPVAAFRAKGKPNRQLKRGKNGLVAPLGTKMGEGSEFGYVDAEGAPDASGTKHHAGKDWFAPAGSTVRAPVGGKIVEVRASRGNSGQVFGGTVKVQAPNGYVFVFRHVDPADLQVGQRVKAGAPIAGVSSWTGGSTHAHLEVWKTLEGGYRYENMIDPTTLFG